MRSVHLSRKPCDAPLPLLPERMWWPPANGRKGETQGPYRGLTGGNYRMHLNASRSTSRGSNPGWEKPSRVSRTYSSPRRVCNTPSCVLNPARRRRHLCHILAHWVDSQLHAGVALHRHIRNSNVGHIERVTLKNEWARGEAQRSAKAHSSDSRVIKEEVGHHSQLCRGVSARP